MPRWIERLGLSLLIIIVSSVMAACGGDDKNRTEVKTKVAPVVTDAWVRATLPDASDMGAVTGAFMVIENQGTAPYRLVRVEVDTDVAESVEIHETTMGENDVMQMRPVDGIAIPAGERVELKPGGYHVMLIGVKQALGPGDTLALKLTFDDEQMITVSADVRAMGQ